MPEGSFLAVGSNNEVVGLFLFYELHKENGRAVNRRRRNSGRGAQGAGGKGMVASEGEGHGIHNEQAKWTIGDSVFRLGFVHLDSVS